MDTAKEHGHYTAFYSCIPYTAGLHLDNGRVRTDISCAKTEKRRQIYTVKNRIIYSLIIKEGCVILFPWRFKGSSAFVNNYK